MDHIKYRFVYQNPETKSFEFEFWTLEQILSGEMFEQTTHPGIKPFAVNRFAERQDKNGKDIYEKDFVIQYPQNHKMLGYLNSQNLEKKVVDLKQNSFFFGFSLTQKGIYQWAGNVYEHSSDKK